MNAKPSEVEIRINNRELERSRGNRTGQKIKMAAIEGNKKRYDNKSQLGNEALASEERPHASRVSRMFIRLR